MLSSIPDRELVARLEQLRRDERASCVDILHHLNEIERRSLHLRRGYSSLFAYCIGHLHYSESAAARRVQAARCLRRFPAVGPLLQSGEINLMTLGLVANIMTEATLDSWIDRIRGKTQREVEAIAAAVRPPLRLRDRARLVLVAVPVASPLPLAPTSPAPADASTSPAPADGSTSQAPAGAPTSPAPAGGSIFLAPADAPTSPAPMSASSSDTSSDASSRDASAEPPAPGVLVNSSTNSQTGGKQPTTAIVTQPKVYIQFLADQSFMAKYRSAAALLSNKLPKLTFETVFAALIEEFLRRNQPAERQLRRERSAARADHAALRVAIPLRTRDAVFTRDHGRCTFVGSDGKRCDETIRLHIDHVKPVACGGSNDVSNLRLLCAQHNRLQAEKILGREVTSRFRDRAGTGVTRA